MTLLSCVNKKKLMNDRHLGVFEGSDIIENIIHRIRLDFPTILIGNSSFLLEFVVRRFDSQKKNQFKLTELKLQKYVLSYISAFITFTLDETKSSHPPVCSLVSSNLCNFMTNRSKLIVLLQSISQSVSI